MNTLRKFLSALLCLALLVSLLPLGVQPARAAGENTLEGDGTENDPYQIYNAEDLRAFAEKVNSYDPSNPYSEAEERNAWAELRDDIDLEGTEWTRIGSSDINYNLEYIGTFDGNNHTIRGLSINTSSTSDVYFGLFGAVGEGGTVRNLTVEGSITVESSDSYVRAGGVAGESDGTVSNCTNRVTIAASSDDIAYVGGVIGANAGNVSNCTNKTVITATANTAYIGGVIGFNGGSLTNCSNSGAVEGTGQTANGAYVGGIVGSNSHTEIVMGSVENCYNTGTVTATGSNAVAGGVAGINLKTVSSCYNIGMVSGTTAGGVVGANSYGSTSGTVKGCYYLDTAAGSAIGDSSGISENVASKTNEEFASGEVAWLLQDALGENADQAWGQKLSGETPDEYPVLTSDTSKKVYQVTFKDSGSTFATDYANSGDTATKPTDPTQTGYTFGGWYSDESLTDDWNFDTNTVTDDITLHAKWTVCTYTVTFDTNSGTINSGNITEYTYGEGAKLPTDVTRPGYTFGGWYENSNFSGEPVKEISKTDTGNKTYYAKWLSANAGVSSVTVNGVTATLNDTTFTVTLPAGSSLPTADEIQIIPATGADITAGPTTNDGGANWTFTVTAEDGTTTATYTIQVTIALQPTHTVTVSANPAEGGTVSGGGEATEGTEVTVTATPASGYHFVRWTENDTTVSTDTSYTFNLEANRTLVAIFEQDQTPTPDPDPDDPPYNGKYSYEIVSDVGENGTIDVDRYATEGDQVTITVSPDEAYLLDDLTVTSGGKDVALTDNGDGTYTFTMPSGDVAVTATFAEDPNWEEPEDPATDVSEIFTDVPANHWAQAAIQYVYDNGLMTGVSDTAFAPEATTTRAMIVSMLARMENVTSAADAGFTDVAADDWYATAVNWAAANGIVNGISDDTFAPNDPITREQLAAMLMNYAQWKGQDTSARADLSGYSDAPSTWASEAVQWAVAEGLLAGVTDDELQPQGQATRAQVAAIMQRFLEA